jgi:hypothetical protein
MQSKKEKQMKKLAVALVVAGVATTSTVALAGMAAKTGINGSMHDINSAPGNYTHDKFERTCVFCHTPHNAQKISTAGTYDAPLWNHKLTQNPLMTAYTWVSPANGVTTPNHNAIQINNDPLVGPSRLCMACHDGSTAVDSHGTAGSDANGNHAMTSSYLDGLNNVALRYIQDLSVTHPIGFQYDEAAATRGPKEIMPSSSGFIADNALPLNGAAATFDTQNRGTLATTSKKIEDTLYAGFMTCATCHDVHNSVNASPKSGSPSYNYFLYAQEEGSAICLSCHVK